MIKEKQLDELEFIIDYLNNEDNPQIKKISSEVENAKELLKILSRVKVSKIKKILSDNSKKNSVKIQSNYKEEDVKKIFLNSDLDMIIKKYSKKELQEMFLAVYGNSPMANESKKDIVTDIERMILQIGRAKAFFEMDN